MNSRGMRLPAFSGLHGVGTRRAMCAGGERRRFELGAGGEGARDKTFFVRAT